MQREFNIDDMVQFTNIIHKTEPLVDKPKDFDASKRKGRDVIIRDMGVVVSKRRNKSHKGEYFYSAKTPNGIFPLWDKKDVYPFSEDCVNCPECMSKIG